MSLKKPTDEEIIDVIARRGRVMTYVICNVLRGKYAGLETPWVRRHLVALEKAGKVKRVPTDYAVQIRWGLVK